MHGTAANLPQESDHGHERCRAQRRTTLSTGQSKAGECCDGECERDSRLDSPYRNAPRRTKLTITSRMIAPANDTIKPAALKLL